MRSRWSVLALLFFIRWTMAVQFQSVAAIAPLFGTDFGVSLADIGILVGLYSLPGVVLALPGGAIGQRFGDKKTVLAGLVLMMVGSCIMAFSSSWSGQISGRLVAGVGSVLMSVLMTKMVADWFVGKELSTAMAIFVNSWPIGIATALLVLPSIGVAYDVSAANLAVAALVAVGAGLLAVLYRAPANSAGTVRSSGRLGRQAAMAVVCAGSIWALYNIGLVMIFSFGPSMLVEHGWSITAAGSAISVVLWLSAVSGPLGGFLADRSGRYRVIMALCFFVTATLLIAATRTDAIMTIVIALGMFSGLAAGPILSLPPRVLEPDTRAIGMGVFFSISYIGLVLGPTLGGKYATWAGSAGAAFDLGAAVLLICPVILWMFQRFHRGAAIPVRSSS
jgi:MFS family permease